MKQEFSNQWKSHWFMTLTFNPAAREALFIEGEDHHAKALREFSGYIKRLRAKIASLDRTKYRLKFIAVTEPHQDGTPHIHAIIHGDGLAYRVLTGAKWPHGFIKATLCDEGAALYLAKYVAKEAVRVRASNHYGCSAAVDHTKTSEGVAEVRSPKERTKLTPKTKNPVLRAYAMACDTPFTDGVELLSAIVELENGATAPTLKTLCSDVPSKSTAPEKGRKTVKTEPSAQTDIETIVSKNPAPKAGVAAQDVKSGSAPLANEAPTVHAHGASSGRGNGPIGNGPKKAPSPRRGD